MGNRSSRQQTEEQGAQSGSAQRPTAGASGGVVYAQYPSQNQSSSFNRPPQAPIPPPPHPYYPSNGQYYGGWVPPGPSMRPTGSFQQHPYPRAPPLPPHLQQPPQQQQPSPPPAPTQQLTQTATIRNSVNLKKTSLAVSPLPNDPTKLAINFTFDASAPCIVTTFVLATEDGNVGNKLTTAYQPPAPKIQYPKGLGHKFPGPSTTGAEHVIDLNLHEEDLGALSSASENTYPLIVRLEVITEKGLKEGHSLEELSPGAEQETWVQSQTTFAALHKEEDGSWSVRVLKQKIWVEGTSYELQEIYGLEQAGGKNNPAASAVEVEEERLCVICLVNPRDTTVLPCRHMCLCSECASELRKQTSKCPICRHGIESLLHIRIKDKNSAQGTTSSTSTAEADGNESVAGAGAAAEAGASQEPASTASGSTTVPPL